jgi:hypothetical protein
MSEDPDWQKPLREIRSILLHGLVYVAVVATEFGVAASIVLTIKLMGKLLDDELMVFKVHLHDIVYYIEIATFFAYVVLSAVNFFRRLAKSIRDPI